VKRLLYSRSAAIASLILIGWLDYVTGPRLALGPLYLLPVIVVAWYQGKAPAFQVVGAATVAWFLAEAAGSTSPGISIWNTTTRLITFGTVGWTVARLRETEGRLRALLQREKLAARTDPLTGLLNRRGFIEQCRIEFARARRAQTPTGLIFIDLDNFKATNDLYGHDTGDAALQAAARAISMSIRQTDVCGRMGGDEFAVFCWNPTREMLQTTAKRIEHRIAASVPDTGVGASTGITWCDAARDDFESMLRLADADMYRNKRAASRMPRHAEAEEEAARDAESVGNIPAPMYDSAERPLGAAHLAPDRRAAV
jgi:diguanylate cyclase (GGDEF)-like protein